jgi:hypothetical protein
MTVERYTVIFYALFWLVRINGCIRRGKQPLLRGRDWFFTVAVQPGFYEGAGKRILHHYWMRMLIPFVIDIPVAAAIFLSGRVVLMNILIIALCAIIHVNHAINVGIAERQARMIAAAPAEEPVAQMLLSLTPRRLRDYTNPMLERVLAFSCLFAVLYLFRHYTPRLMIVTAFLLYLQLGMLFLKYVIVAWRTPLPQSQAAEYLEAREATRKFYLRMSDYSRICFCVAMLFRLLISDMTGANLDRLLSGWLTAWLAIGVAGTVWGEWKRKQLLSLTLRARPVILPDFLYQPDVARWPVCYQPSAPMLVLKGPNGYSLNMANALASVGAVYTAGLIALFALLLIPH